MPAGQAVSRFGSGIFFTRDALKRHTVSKNGSISFFFSSSYPQMCTLIYSLNSPLSYSGCIVLIVFNKSRPIKIHSCRLYCEGGDPLTPTCVTSKHHLINTGLNLCRDIVNIFWTQVCRFQTEISPFWSRKSKEELLRRTRHLKRWKLESSWRRNRPFFDSLRPPLQTEKRSLRSLRYRNGIPAISIETLSSVTQGKQRNAIFVTQTIPLARIVL